MPIVVYTNPRARHRSPTKAAASIWLASDEVTARGLYRPECGLTARMAIGVVHEDAAKLQNPTLRQARLRVLVAFRSELLRRRVVAAGNARDEQQDPKPHMVNVERFGAPRNANFAGSFATRRSNWVDAVGFRAVPYESSTIAM